MQGATFLLIVNFAIGVLFAASYLIVATQSRSHLGYWSAAGFISAASTVCVEAFAPHIPWMRLTSFLSFTFLLLALSFIASGLRRHYKPNSSLRGIWAFFLICVFLHPSVIYDLPRDSAFHAFAYQGPSAIMAAVASTSVLIHRRLRLIERTVGVVLALCSVQFLLKAGLATTITTGGSVHTYVVSTYAHLSQTAGAVLSLLLGLSLLGLTVSELMRRAADDAKVDALSGTLIRKAFLGEGRELLAKATTSTPCCFIMADLDHFKSVNDRFGHAAGDQVIQFFGETLRDLASVDGICGRLGGEEFAILLARCDESKARLFMQAIQTAMSQREFSFLVEDARVSSSFGAVVCDCTNNFDDVMRLADQALYEAKRAGRDCYRFETSQAMLSKANPKAGSL